MGNAASSCAPSIISSTGAVVKVLIFSEGNLQVYTKPVTAGEVVLQNPGQFVCDSKTLKVGQRIMGVSADEELELRQFYFLLPMELLYSVLTDEEMTALTHKAAKANSKNFGKIFPVLISEFCMFQSEAAKTLETFDSPSPETEEHVERFSKQRSWKPALETIPETPCSSSRRKILL